jgi:anti-sigma regulatory factor (Ser/Thr protein kinase)
MISRLLSAHVAPALFGSGVGITLIHYVFDRIPYISVGAGFALVLGGFLLWAMFSEE